MPGSPRIACTIMVLHAILLWSVVPIRADELPAFPGAVGQGATASGGRGGDVYHVTTLADYDPKKEAKIPGSLRHALRSGEGRRTIVFDAGGAIGLHAPLKIFKSDITIAGQTAPGAGITLWGYPVEVSKGSNVVIRYLRVRLGDFHARLGDSTKPHPYKGNNDLDPGSANAVAIGGGCERVIVDHLSTSWSMDEVLSVTVCKDVTVQNSIIAHSLNDSFHPKGSHGFGSLVRGELTPTEQAAATGGFTFFQNLWAHNRARNPSLGGQQSLDKGQSEADRRRTDVNVVNNVVYNWLDQPIHRSGSGEVRANIIGNYVICGPAKSAFRIFSERTADRTLVCQAGNAIDWNQDSQHDGRLISTPKEIAKTFRDFGAGDQILGEDSAEPFSFLNGVAKNVKSAEVAYNEVIEGVGCSLVRDAIDEALIRSVVERGGKPINSQEELRESSGNLAGIDDLDETRRPEGFDTDGDGMPNDFEVKHGLDPAHGADGNGTKLSDEGYTNLEVYLDSQIHSAGNWEQ